MSVPEGLEQDGSASSASRARSSRAGSRVAPSAAAASVRQVADVAWIGPGGLAPPVQPVDDRGQQAREVEVEVRAHVAGAVLEVSPWAGRRDPDEGRAVADGPHRMGRRPRSGQEPFEAVRGRGPERGLTRRMREEAGNGRPPIGDRAAVIGAIGEGVLAIGVDHAEVDVKPGTRTGPRVGLGMNETRRPRSRASALMRSRAARKRRPRPTGQSVATTARTGPGRTPWRSGERGRPSLRGRRGSPRGTTSERRARPG